MINHLTKLMIFNLMLLKMTRTFLFLLLRIKLARWEVIRKAEVFRHLATLTTIGLLHKWATTPLPNLIREVPRLLLLLLHPHTVEFAVADRLLVIRWDLAVDGSVAIEPKHQVRIPLVEGIMTSPVFLLKAIEVEAEASHLEAAGITTVPSELALAVVKEDVVHDSMANTQTTRVVERNAAGMTTPLTERVPVEVVPV
jgi:hypothetical protein